MLNISQFSPGKLKDTERVLATVIDHFTTDKIQPRFNKISLLTRS